MPGLTHYYSQILGHDLAAIRYIDEDFVGGKLDTGAVYGGRLTAMVLLSGEKPPPAPDRTSVLVSVPARREYV